MPKAAHSTPSRPDTFEGLTATVERIASRAPSLLVPASVAAGLLASGCFLRPEVRRVDARYRSAEAYGSAHWGMTHDELAQVVPDSVPCGAERACRDETLEGRAAHVSYELSQGRLARVRVRVESSEPKADFERFKQELTQAYGSRGQVSSARVHLGPYAVIALMDTVDRLYVPVVGPLLKTDLGWTTAETEMRLEEGPPPEQWLELVLTSRMLGPPVASAVDP